MLAVISDIHANLEASTQCMQTFGNAVSMNSSVWAMSTAMARSRATWSSARRPVVLVYQESHADLNSAIRRERQLKKWSRAKMEALIAGDLERLKAINEEPACKLCRFRISSCSTYPTLTG